METKLDLQKMLKMLSQESKFKIMMHLRKGEECVCAIAEDLGMEQSLVSHHINDLRDAGLVINRKIGTWVHCSLNKPMFKEIQELYLSYLGPESIAEKLCSIHDECKCLIKGDENEK